jgi:uncharacterized protein
MTEPSQSRVRAHIDGDPVLQHVLRFTAERMHADAAHDLAHCFRVADWTLRIAGGVVAPRLCVAAALLHDVVNIPKNRADRATASEQSADAARTLLGALGLADADVALVAAAIRDHSFTRGAVPESLLGEALQDADRLEALGVIGTFRCIATGVRFDAAFFDDADPWAEHRPLDDKRFSIDHFFTKLLRLPATFRTEIGRREAERRAAFMRQLLDQLATELEHPVAR